MRTKIRDVPLVVHVDYPERAKLVILQNTCRLCPDCDMLVAHDAEIAASIAASRFNPNAGKSRYVVLGTVERRVWRAGLAGGVELAEVRKHRADFKAYMRVDVTPAGWYPEVNCTERPATGRYAMRVAAAAET